VALKLVIEGHIELHGPNNFLKIVLIGIDGI
jgi:hypothetical protein